MKEKKDDLLSSLKQEAIERVKLYLSKLTNIRITQFNKSNRKPEHIGSFGIFELQYINPRHPVSVSDSVLIAKIEELVYTFKITQGELGK